jgi:hypothetical protein
MVELAGGEMRREKAHCYLWLVRMDWAPRRSTL